MTALERQIDHLEWSIKEKQIILRKLKKQLKRSKNEKGCTDIYL